MQHRIGARLGRAITMASLLGSLVVVALPASGVSAATCLATGALDRDGTALTARMINPAATVSGTVDATGCGVGVYFNQGAHGRVAGAEVFGARYYGVLVDGNNGHVVHVDVTKSTFHDVGDPTLTSARHGQGVAYRSFGAGSATGTVSLSRFWNFQETAINMTGPGSTATASGNIVQGRGPNPVIAQNGIQVIFGAHGTVRANLISGLSYTGAQNLTGNGVLLAGGPIYNGDPTKGCLPSGCDYVTGVLVAGNVITGSDTGIVMFNADEDFNPPSSPSANVARGNVIHDRALTNVNGWDVGLGVQEGIFAYGNADQIVNNVIGGRGYDQDFCGDAAICMAIDTAGAIDPFISGNVVR